MECYYSSCDITGGVILPSYKLQEGYLSSQCLIKFSWKVSRSERCFQHVSNLCVTLESHIQLTLITTDFKRGIVGVPCAYFFLLLAGEVKVLAGVLFLFIKIIEFFFASEKTSSSSIVLCWL